MPDFRSFSFAENAIFYYGKLFQIVEHVKWNVSGLCKRICSSISCEFNESEDDIGFQNFARAA